MHRKIFKNAGWVYCFILMLLVCSASQVNGAGTRERILFNENWRFQKGDPAGQEERWHTKRSRTGFERAGISTF